MLGAGLGLLIGVLAALATPPVAARFAVPARWWVCALGGAPAGAALGWKLDGLTLAVWLVALAVGVPLTAIDLGAHRLPDVLVLPAVAAAVVVAVAGGAVRAVLAGAALVVAYGALAVLPRSGLGFGDVKLAGLLGVALGSLGWNTVAWGTALAFVFGGVAALVLMATGRAGRETPLPFGPAMLAGAWLAAVAPG